MAITAFEDALSVLRLDKMDESEMDEDARALLADVVGLEANRRQRRSKSGAAKMVYKAIGDAATRTARELARESVGLDLGPRLQSAPQSAPRESFQIPVAVQKGMAGQNFYTGPRNVTLDTPSWFRYREPAPSSKAVARKSLGLPDQTLERQAMETKGQVFTARQLATASMGLE